MPEHKPTKPKPTKHDPAIIPPDVVELAPAPPPEPPAPAAPAPAPPAPVAEEAEVEAPAKPLELAPVKPPVMEFAPMPKPTMAEAFEASVTDTPKATGRQLIDMMTADGDSPLMQMTPGIPGDPSVPNKAYCHTRKGRMYTIESGVICRTPPVVASGAAPEKRWHKERFLGDAWERSDGLQWYRQTADGKWMEVGPVF